MVGPSKQANIHTHGLNEVTLVWGSLRLTPTTSALGEPGELNSLMFVVFKNVY